jgi:DNA helicase-2/ATP-dependent DNA helicase PcrA
MATRDLLEGLTLEQREAVLHKDGPLLIVAGAGSGKTRVVTRRIARLVATGTPRTEILAITFTNKAAGEMRARVEELLPPFAGKTGGVTVSTFHSFAVKVLREHAPRLGYGADFSILDPDDQLALVREAAVAARVDVQRFQPPLLLHVIGRAKERLDDAAFAVSARPGLEQEAARVLPVYRARAKERNAFDFDDLVASTVFLLEGHEDVREALLDRIRYVSIDEYQDTNHAQYRLARLLAGKRRNLAVVGDPDQSIYGWRGADMRNILRFEEDFPETKVVKLEKNYRSTATILRASNALIARNKDRKEKQLLPTAGEGGPIEVHRALDEDYEADYVSRRVEEAIAFGTKPSEIAVIYRANALSRRYEDALLRRNIPFETVGSVSFFERREVKDTLAYLRLAANPRDDLAALRALKSPPRGLGERTFEKLHGLQRELGVTFLETCARAGELATLSPHARTALTGFAALAGELVQGASGSVESLVRTTIERTGFERHLLATDEKGKERCESLHALVDAAREADRSRQGDGAGARGFLEKLALRDAQDDKDDTRERVNLTSIHASKGLEFEVVICVALEEGIFPHERAVEEGSLEEERRLAYVAFTRAKKKLILTYAGFRGGRAARETRSASTFMVELPRELLWDPERKRVPELSPPPERKVRKPSPPASAAVETGARAVPLWKRGLTATGPARPAPPAPPAMAPPLTVAPVAPVAPARAGAVDVGARVRHERLGEGVVTEFAATRTGGSRVRVRFDGAGERWLVVGFEPLAVC